VPAGLDSRHLAVLSQAGIAPMTFYRTTLRARGARHLLPFFRSGEAIAFEPRAIFDETDRAWHEERCLHHQGAGEVRFDGKGADHCLAGMLATTFVPRSQSSIRLQEIFKVPGKRGS